MKKNFYSFILLVLILPCLSYGQLQIINPSTPYDIHFSSFSGLGFQPIPAAGQLSSNHWSVTGFSDGSLPFDSTRATAGTDFTRGVSNGKVNTGGIYAFNTGAGNIILGVQPIAADFTPGDIRLRIVNQSGATFTKLFISYDLFYLNNEDRSNNLNFSTSTNNITYTNMGALDFATPDTADSSAQWIRVSKYAFITGLNIPVDSLYYFRWRGSDNSGSGSRDEYGIDNISIVANPPNIIGNFAVSDVCENDSMMFTDLSTSINGNVNSWSWNFGDGTGLSNVQNPSYLYTGPGIYSVQLVVTNDSAETDTVTKQVTVFSNPEAFFVHSGICVNSPVLFTDSSSIAADSIISYIWNFGDSSLDSIPNPVHPYASSGNFNVTLSLTSDKGCVDNYTTTVKVYDVPVIDSSNMVVINPSCGASDGSVTGLNVSGASPFTYIWNPGMQSTIDLTNAGGGTYSIVVSDSNNCSATASFTLTSAGAPPAPTVNSPAPYCDGDVIDSLVATGTGGSITWYDDSLLLSQVGSGNTFLPPLSLGDNYFYVTETSTCQGPFSVVTVTINPVPSANAGTDGGVCSGNCIQLSGSGGGNYQWLPATCLDNPSVANPLMCCFGPDTIQYLLIVTNNFGCKDTDDVMVVIHENPVAGFSFTQASCDSAYFTDGSSGNIVSWQWNFGDSSQSVEQNPAHIFSMPLPNNVYAVSLVVTNNFGCTDSLTNDSVAITCTSVNELSLPDEIFIYPNPTNGKIIISLMDAASAGRTISIDVLNVLGEKIPLEILNNPQTGWTIDFSGQPEGTYLIYLFNEERSVVKKLVLVR